NVSDYGKDYSFLSGGQDIKCKNCGKTLNKDFKYCPFCGKLNLS
ncbi:MAG: zinc-ribbon domain-containing protein, partial [Deltaproteobacteria bacterium]|nr:zinc-ribbon domain-containing protein [Deltaproteobacteria bacterium]